MQSIPVLVYQMGKVGSTSIHAALAEREEFDVFHIHTLRESQISALSEVASAANLPIPGHIQEAQSVLDSGVLKRNVVKIITMVREPLNRNISDLFENFLPEDVAAGRGTGSAVQTAVEDLQQFFLNTYNHKNAMSWFDREFLVSTGIDVYGSKCNSRGRFRPMREKNLEVLILRCEDPDAYKAKAVEKFLELDRGQLEFGRENVGSLKPYAAVYEAFRESLKIPPELSQIYRESKLGNHFYTSEEQISLRRKYIK